MKYNTGSLIVLGYISTAIAVELAFIDEIAGENKLYRHLGAKFYKRASYERVLLYIYIYLCEINFICLMFLYHMKQKLMRTRTWPLEMGNS